MEAGTQISVGQRAVVGLRAFFLQSKHRKYFETWRIWKYLAAIFLTL